MPKEDLLLELYHGFKFVVAESIGLCVEEIVFKIGGGLIG
jgi:hypothetical protein